MNNQENRINEMEYLLDTLNELCDCIIDSLNKFEKNKENFKKLEEYYQSELWMKDFEDDEKGLLHMKRGVLSEDGISNCLIKRDEIINLLKNDNSSV